VNQLAACWRVWRVLVHVLSGLAQILLLFPRLSQQQRGIRVQVWADKMLARLGVTLKVSGTPPRIGPMLLVANHISWLDIVVLHAARHCRFVSKSDVRDWPLVGTLASAAGTLYIERESRRDAMRVVQRMAQALQEGDILAVFPEGTTGDGIEMLPFHANLIQAAISAQAPAQPVALQFVDGRNGKPSCAVSYVGDESLLGSIWRTLCARHLCAGVVFGAVQLADGRDRRAWARDLRTAIVALRES
jgi:1-acyl-sn-glycerol-3-phosphate acyltransferase